MKKMQFLFSLMLMFNYCIAQEKPIGLGLKLFKNMEQIEYCIPLPLKEFRKIYNQESANHLFVHTKNKKLTIQIKGFYSDDKNITLENYFTKSYTEQDEAVGKIVTQKEVLKNKQCFYAFGYYNNFIGLYEFIEVTWVRNDEVTRLEIMYPTKEKKLWYERLKLIIKNAYCR